MALITRVRSAPLFRRSCVRRRSSRSCGEGGTTRRTPCTLRPVSSRSRLTHRISLSAWASRRSVLRRSRFSAWISTTSRQPHAGQELRQPIVEAADFENGDVTIAACAGRNTLQEQPRLLAPRAYLPSQQHLAVHTAQADGQLLAVQIDSQVQHRGGPPR